MRNFKKILASTLAYGWLLMGVTVVLVPILWMINAAFSKGILLSGVSLFPDPSKFSFEHFEYLFTYVSTSSQTMADYPAAFLRTLSIAVVNTVGVVTFGVITGFVFARLNFIGKKKLLLTMMVLQMFPSFMGMIALFLLFRQFGWLNQPMYLALIYTAGSIPYNTFLVRGFMRNIPRSLDEAAAIDGATNLQILRRILFPLIVPIIGFIAVSAFMAPWLDFMLQNVMLPSKDQITVAVWLYRTTDPFNTLFYNPLTFMAGALLIAIPVMVVQFFMQKYMVYGLTSGAEKG
ncbi:MAG: ABC transporter permease [Erysipelotrichaceae bacterium]|nr:MAG: ABC transporter [Erysipelotrichaceae bacterium]TXT19798.1 MAG: ABC transporter permease [Erysipelotrichaceae bacterium]